MEKDAKIAVVSVLLFIIIILLIIPLLGGSQTMGSPYLPAIPNGTEILSYGYKYSNSSNIIISTKPSVSCSWKPDSIDDGWKFCEAIFEVENQNAIKPIIDPILTFAFANPNIRNSVISFSNTFSLENETYINISYNLVNITNEEGETRTEVNRTEEPITFTKRRFDNFASPSVIDTSQPFAIKLVYEAPKYQGNTFNLTILGEGFYAFIDPIQSECSNNLNQENATYTLDQSVSSTGTCFTIVANSITLNGNGYTITYGGGNQAGAYGIYVAGVNDIIIKNFGEIKARNASGSSQYGIYLLNSWNSTVRDISAIRTNGSNHNDGIVISGGHNATITGVGIVTFGTTGAFASNDGIDLTGSNHTIIGNNINASEQGTLSDGIEGGGNILFNNITTRSSIGYGINLGILAGGGNLLNITGNTIVTSGSSGRGIFISGGVQNSSFIANKISTSGSGAEAFYISNYTSLAPINNIVFDSIFNASNSNDTFLAGDSFFLNFTNVTLINNRIGFHPSSTATLNVHWWLDALADYSNGSLASDVNISAWDVNNIWQFSVLTGSDGRIPKQSLLEYKRNGIGGTTTTYYSNYTFNAISPFGETLTQSWNMSQNRFLIFTFDATPPNVTLVSPEDNEIRKDVNIAFSCNVTDNKELKNVSLYFLQEKTISFQEGVSPPSYSGTRDTYINGNTPTTPYGTATSLNFDGDNPEASVILKWNVSSIPAGSQVLNATITVISSQSPGDSHEYELYEMKRNWIETEVTWNVYSTGNNWQTAGAQGANDRGSTVFGTIQFPSGTGVGDSYVVNLNSNGIEEVQDWVDNPSTNYGVIIQDYVVTNGGDIYSREAATANYHPRLTISYRTSWHLNQTKIITGIQNLAEFDLLTLEDNSTYKWNCLAYDAVGESDWEDSNFTLIINSSYNYPPQVILQYPPHNSINIPRNVTLNVTVIDPEGTLMNVTYFGREVNNTNFTIIALPDTQYYSQTYYWIFDNQTHWINNTKSDLNTLFVSHEGDITQNFNNPNYEVEWIRANNSMSVLDDQVPYGVLPGNHDMSGGIGGGNTDLFNKYFPVERYNAKPWWGGNFDRNDNNYQLFSAGGVDYIIIHIEFQANGTTTAARQPVYRWINETLEKYPNRSAIITTHDYLQTNNIRSAFGNDLWNNVIKTHPNVFLVLSGHFHATGDGEGRTSEPNIAGKQVHQVMADYQEFFDTAPLSATLSQRSGLLRIMKFVPVEKRVYVKTFSPYLSSSQCQQAGGNYRWNSDALIEPIGCYRNHTDAEFSFNYTPFNEIGKHLNVINGTIATYTWRDRKLSTTYEWYVEVVDSKGTKTNSSVWNFTTTT